MPSLGGRATHRRQRACRVRSVERADVRQACPQGGPLVNGGVHFSQARPGSVQPATRETTEEHAMKSQELDLELRTGVVVEKEMWMARQEILWLTRDHPAHPADSGWTAGHSDEPNAWMIVALEELLARDASVLEVLTGKHGDCASRRSTNYEWIPCELPPES